MIACRWDHPVLEEGVRDQRHDDTADRAAVPHHPCRPGRQRVEPLAGTLVELAPHPYDRPQAVRETWFPLYCLKTSWPESRAGSARAPRRRPLGRPRRASSRACRAPRGQLVAHGDSGPATPRSPCGRRRRCAARSPPERRRVGMYGGSRHDSAKVWPTSPVPAPSGSPTPSLISTRTCVRSVLRAPAPGRPRRGPGWPGWPTKPLRCAAFFDRLQGLPRLLVIGAEQPRRRVAVGQGMQLPSAPGVGVQASTANSAVAAMDFAASVAGTASMPSLVGPSARPHRPPRATPHAQSSSWGGRLASWSAIGHSRAWSRHRQPGASAHPRTRRRPPPGPASRPSGDTVMRTRLGGSCRSTGARDLGGWRPAIRRPSRGRRPIRTASSTTAGWNGYNGSSCGTTLVAARPGSPMITPLDLWRLFRDLILHVCRPPRRREPRVHRKSSSSAA